MPTYSVKVYCERTCWDHAWIEVEARNVTEARNAALTLAEAGDVDDWECAKAETYESTGKFDVGDTEEISDDEA